MNARPLMRLRLTTAATLEVGSTPHGMLSVFPITGGSFDGERLRGLVLGGADWVTAAADGTFELDLRLTLETDDGALIPLRISGAAASAYQKGWCRTMSGHTPGRSATGATMPPSTHSAPTSRPWTPWALVIQNAIAPAMAAR